MPKLLAASKIQPLDRYLVKNKELTSRGFDIVIPVFGNYSELAKLSAEVIENEDCSVSAPVVVLSSSLGKGKVIESEAIYPLRALGFRVILLPGDAMEESTKSLVKAAVSLGVYDFVYDPYSGSDVIDRILNPATLADVDLPFTEGSSEKADKPTQIDEVVNKPTLVRRIAEGLTDWVFPVVNVNLPGNKTTTDLDSNSDMGKENTFLTDGRKCNLPPGFASLDELPGAQLYSSVQELVSMMPSAILLSSSRPGLVDEIRCLRREYVLSSAPIIIIGDCNATACYAAGADECVKALDGSVVERIQAMAARMREMWSKAVKDDLTGLYEREYLNHYLTEQVRRYKETGVAFSIMMADLDHFKTVNDTYGHPAGDAVLREFALFLSAGVRPTDVVARYGGEEFVVVFSGLAEAWDIADRLCREWASKEIELPDGRGIHSTFSAGLAANMDAREAGTLLKAADDALYRAKAAGRNRVVQAGKAVQEPAQEEMPKLKVKKVWNIQRPVNELKLTDEEWYEPENYHHMEDLIKQVNARVITVWNLNGQMKAKTALELARSLKAKAGKVALLEFDTVNPELDEIFKVPMPPLAKCANKDPSEIGAGLVTFGDKTTPELAASFLHKYRWGIYYLPAGNKLDVLSRTMNVDGLCKLIDMIVGKYKCVIIDACPDTGNETAQAAIRKSEVVVVVVPMARGSSATVKKQVNWLKRLGVAVIEYNPPEEKTEKQRRGFLWLKG